MGIKESLAEEFGVTVRIAGGTGPKNDPFVLEPCSALEATHTQLEVLRLMARRMRFMYRLRDCLMEPEAGPNVQAIVFDRGQPRDGELHTETVACHFNIAAVEGEPHAGEPLYVWGDPRSPILLPHELGWLHYSGSRDYAEKDGPLNQSCAYHAPGAAATVYVYEHGAHAHHEDEREAMRAAEIAEVTSVVLAGEEKYAETHAPGELGPFAVRILGNADMITIIAVAALDHHFVKARISFQTIPPLMDQMIQTLGELGGIVAHAHSSHAH